MGERRDGTGRAGERKVAFAPAECGGVRCEDSSVATGVDLKVGDVGAEEFRKKAMPVILT